jgi:hypothetical protein
VLEYIDHLLVQCPFAWFKFYQGKEAACIVPMQFETLCGSWLSLSNHQPTLKRKEVAAI